MAISLALHQAVTALGIEQASKDNLIGAEFGGSIYSLDRTLCAKSGNSITIQDDDIDVEFPSNSPEVSAFSPGVVLHCYTRLSQILVEITTSIYRERLKSGLCLMASVQRIIPSL